MTQSKRTSGHIEDDDDDAALDILEYESGTGVKLDVIETDDCGW